MGHPLAKPFTNILSHQLLSSSHYFEFQGKERPESLMQSTAMICAEFPLEEQPDTMEALLTAGFYCHHVTDKSTVPRPPALPVTIARASEHPFYAAPQHCGVKTQDLLSRQTCHHHLPARATVPSRSQLPSPSYSFTLLSMPRAGGHELLMELGISTPQLPGLQTSIRAAGKHTGPIPSAPDPGMFSSHFWSCRHTPDSEHAVFVLPWKSSEMNKGTFQEAFAKASVGAVGSAEDERVSDSTSSHTRGYSHTERDAHFPSEFLSLLLPLFKKHEPQQPINPFRTHMALNMCFLVA
ncbi:hypothetical protein Q9966_002973 [Columba livia]|nr:hypothetical protein Q9966_002973 [Columba livia]